jgi:O-antigen ligase
MLSPRTLALALTFAAAFLLRRTEMMYLYWVLCGGTAVAAALSPRIKAVRRTSAAVVAYTVLGVGSYVWNDDRASSWRAVVTVAATLALVTYCARRVQPLVVLRCIAAGAFIDLVISLMYATRAGDRARTVGLEGGLRGLFTHKNWLALAAGVLLIIVLSHLRQLRSFRGLTVLAVAAVALYEANSKGALIAFGVAITALEGKRISQRALTTRSRRLLYAAAGIATVPVIAEIWTNVLNIAVALNKGKSVGRRLQLWQLVVHYGSQRPVLGWGLRGSWNNHAGVTQRIVADIDPRFGAFGAHNAYVDTFLQLGLVGLVIVAYLLVSTIRAHFMSRSKESDTWFALVTFVCVFSLSDSFFSVHVGLILLAIAHVYRPRGTDGAQPRAGERTRRVQFA